MKRFKVDRKDTFCFTPLEIEAAAAAALKLKIHDLVPPQMISKPLARKLVKGVIALELLGVFGAYSLFHVMNTSQGDTGETINT